MIPGRASRFMVIAPKVISATVVSIREDEFWQITDQHVSQILCGTSLDVLLDDVISLLSFKNAGS